MRTAITSPRFAAGGSWTRATMSGGVQTGGLRDLHLGASRPVRAVRELRDGKHALRAGEPPIVGRIAEDQVLLDVRTIADAELDAVAAAVKQL